MKEVSSEISQYRRWWLSSKVELVNLNKCVQGEKQNKECDDDCKKNNCKKFSMKNKNN